MMHEYQPSVLAPSPRYFLDDIRHDWSSKSNDTRIRLSDGEIMLTLYICPLVEEQVSQNSSLWKNKYLGFLDSVIGDDWLSRPAILLEPVEEGMISYRRCYERPTLFCIKSEGTKAVSLGIFYGDAELFDCQPQGKLFTCKLVAALTIHSTLQDGESEESHNQNSHGRGQYSLSC